MFFDTFRQFSRRAKNVKNRQKVSKSFSTFSTIFARHHFSGPFWGALIRGRRDPKYFRILGGLLGLYLGVDGKR